MSLHNVADLLFDRGIGVSHEMVHLWWNRFGPLFAADIRRQPAGWIRGRQWRWHVDEVCHPTGGIAIINGEWPGLGMIPRIISCLRTSGAPMTTRVKS